MAIAKPMQVRRLGHSKCMGHLPLEIGPKAVCLIQQLASEATLKPDLVRDEKQRGDNESFGNQSHVLLLKTPELGLSILRL